MREFQTMSPIWTPMPGNYPYRLQWEDGDLVRHWRGPRKGQSMVFRSFESALRTYRSLPHRVIFAKPKN